MNIDSYIFERLQSLQAFEKWWASLPESYADLCEAEWDEQFIMWLNSEF